MPQFVHRHPSICPSPLPPHTHGSQFEDVHPPHQGPPGPCHPLQPISYHGFPDVLGSGTLEHCAVWESSTFWALEQTTGTSQQACLCALRALFPLPSVPFPTFFTRPIPLPPPVAEGGRMRFRPALSTSDTPSRMTSSEQPSGTLPASLGHPDARTPPTRAPSPCSVLAPHVSPGGEQRL